MSDLMSLTRSTRALLLDFDGPTCHVFAGYPADGIASDMRTGLTAAGTDLPTEVTNYDDPLAVLTWTARNHPDRESLVEDILQAGEERAIETAQPTPYVKELLNAASLTGRPVVIVSNNSSDAIAKYLEIHGLTTKVDGIEGRPAGMPLKMKPNPHLLIQAADLLNLPTRSCTMIGDSATDVQGAQNAGTKSIGFAKDDQRARVLNAAGADVVIRSLKPLVDALLKSS